MHPFEFRSSQSITPSNRLNSPQSTLEVKSKQNPDPLTADSKSAELRRRSSHRQPKVATNTAAQTLDSGINQRFDARMKNSNKPDRLIQFLTTSAQYMDLPEKQINLLIQQKNLT